MSSYSMTCGSMIKAYSSANLLYKVHTWSSVKFWFWNGVFTLNGDVVNLFEFIYKMLKGPMATVECIK